MITAAENTRDISDGHATPGCSRFQHENADAVADNIDYVGDDGDVLVTLVFPYAAATKPPLHHKWQGTAGTEW